MTIQVGDKVPSTNFKTMTDEGPKDISSNEVFGGKKVVLFAVPGAFTPGCSKTHLPGFVVKATALFSLPYLLPNRNVIIAIAGAGGTQGNHDGDFAYANDRQRKNVAIS